MLILFGGSVYKTLCKWASPLLIRVVKLRIYVAQAQSFPLHVLKGTDYFRQKWTWGPLFGESQACSLASSLAISFVVSPQINIQFLISSLKSAHATRSQIIVLNTRLKQWTSREHRVLPSQPEVYGLHLNYYGDTVQQSILHVEIKLHTPRTYSRLAVAFTLCFLHASLTVSNKSGEMGAKQPLGWTKDSQQSQGIGTS